MRENNSGFKIDESQRQSWLSIAAVWAGGMICVPCLMIGGVLAGGGLSLGQIVLSILIGYGLICVYMICIGMQACDTGLPVSVMASGALGEKGARYIISALLAIACVGWFGIQSATCGSAFASMVANMLGTEATPIFISISSIVWGVIMLLTACVGFRASSGSTTSPCRFWSSSACTVSLPVSSQMTAAAPSQTMRPRTPPVWCLASRWWLPPSPWAA